MMRYCYVAKSVSRWASARHTPDTHTRKLTERNTIKQFTPIGKRYTHGPYYNADIQYIYSECVCVCVVYRSFIRSYNTHTCTLCTIGG